ncbi:MAG: SDR family NAD(P)-dependent oxidoreductase [Candidatus Omnitrophota bacterium]
MQKNLFDRLELYRQKKKLSVLALCRELGINNINYYRWKKAGKITGPYRKIVESFLESDVSSNVSRKSCQSSCSSGIAVIGMSCFYPGAHNIKELWENILARRIQFRRILDQRLPLSEYYDENGRDEKSYLTKAAFIDGFEFDWSKWRIPKKVFESTDIVHWLALHVAHTAFLDAGYNETKHFKTETTGVIVGNTLTGEQVRSQTMRLRWPFVHRALRKTLEGFDVPEPEREKFAIVMEEIYKSAFYPATEDSLAGGLANTIAGRICNYFKFNGGGYIVDGACSSSLLAVATAVNALKSGDMDLALAGGVDVSLDPFELVGFSKAGAFAKDQMRVYDRRGAGFLPGEGCGFIVLKRMDDAEKDGDRIYAVIKGCGISSDGKGGIMEPSSEGQAHAIKRAYKEAGYTPAQLDFVEGHGTGTIRGDQVELGGIALAIEQTGGKDAVRSCGVTSFKSVVGHTKAAAGIGGLIKAVMAVNQRVLPPVANCYEPHPIFEKEAISIYPAIQGRIFDKDKQVRAGISAAGFGGINCHVTLQSYQAPLENLKPSLDERAILASAQKTELFVFSSRTVEHLKHAVRKFKDSLRFISQAEMTDFAYWLNTQSKKNTPVKAAVVADTPEHLFDALCTIENFLSQNVIESGQKYKIKSGDANTYIVLGYGIKGCRIGFLYPGQASQQLNMTRQLFERYDWVRDFLKNAKFPLEKFIYQSLDQFITDEERRELKNALGRTEITQPAVVFSSLAWTEFLSRLWIEPSAVGGHSLGELSAFYKAGAFDARELMEFAELRGNVMSAKSKAGMLALLCSLKDAEGLIRISNTNATIANINGPKQIILSGEDSAIAALEQAARQKSIRTKVLPVSNAFHSPLMEEASNEIGKFMLLQKTFNSSNAPVVFSGMKGESCKGKIDLADYFARQVIHGVDFVNLVKQMARDCDILLEVGPGRILSGLVKQIRVDAPCFPMEGDSEDDRDMNVALAELFVRGKEICFKLLYENRLIRPFVPVSRKKFITNQCERTFKDFAKVQSGLAKRIKDVDFAGEVVRPDMQGLKTIPLEQAGLVESVTADAQNQVEQVLVDQVCRLTGFEKESVLMNLRLLDDLNLDSIKAAELIGQVTQILGIAGEIDPSQHSNKTLAEISAMLEGLVKEGALEGPAQENKDFDFKRYGDKGWVRNFIIEYQENPLDAKDLSKDFGFKQARILAESQEPLVDALRKAIPVKEKNADALICILPRRKTGEFSSDDLRRIIARFHQVISIAFEETENTRLVAFVQFGGGFFGERNERPAWTETCCARAFASTLHLEHPDLVVKVLDFDPRSSTDLISLKVADELKVIDKFSAVGYNEDFVRRSSVFTLSEPCGYRKRNIAWSDKDVVMVTGGAKGITLECALEFARFSRAQMILTGRTPVPGKKDSDSAVAAALTRFSSDGLRADYFSCDVTSEGSVKDLFKKVKAKYGTVTGIIHGAGLNTLRKLKGSEPGEVLKESLPKVMGAVNLFAAADASQLKLFSALTSVIGVTGMEASGWYGLANEVLNLMLKDFGRCHPDVETCAIAYSVWDETGMGVNLGSVDWLTSRGIGSIPVMEGVKRFKNLVEYDSGYQQTIVAARTAGLDTWKTQVWPGVETPLRFVEDIKYYLPGVELIARCFLNKEKDAYIIDHNWKGSLLFPLVFGLEAMAQAYAKLTGERGCGRWQFSDVRLDRPIPVDELDGTTIEIRALGLEKEGKGPAKAKVEIYCEGTGFREAHFAAIVSVEPESVFKKIPPGAAKAVKDEIDLDVKTDLYGPILFQGGPFQCIEKIHRLYYDESTRKGECVFTSACHKSANEFLKKYPFFGDRFLIGDPFFIDSLLQSMQVIVSQDACLPTAIDSVKIVDEICQSSSAFSYITRSSDDYYIGDAKASGKCDRIEIKNCRLKILESLPNNPMANEIADPARRIERQINIKLSEIKNEFKVELPVVKCLVDSKLRNAPKALRHKIEIQLIQDAVNQVLVNGVKNTIKKVNVRWLKNGRPVIENKAAEGIGISLSHTDDLLVCVAGYGKQGCDVEIVKERTVEEWESLLGPINSRIFQKLKPIYKDKDLLGSCIWSLVESFFKCFEKYNKIEIGEIYNEKLSFVFKTSDNDYLGYAVFIAPVLGRKLVFSYLNSNSKKIFGEDLFSRMGYNPKAFQVKIDYSGPQEQLVIIKSNPITFRTNKLPSKRVFFTSYFDWLGEVREQSANPIMNHLAGEFSSGQWGLATYFTKFEILSDLVANDILEIHFWSEEVNSAIKGTYDLCADWQKITPLGKRQRVALSRQRITWVRILGRGVAQVAELPKFLEDFMEKMKGKSLIKKPLEDLPEQYQVLKKGRRLFFSDMIGDKKPVLYKKRFETSFEDSNLVGNIYFSNYAKWLGRVFDHFIYTHAPEIVISKGAANGEFTCIKCEINNLNEAMPFDEIQVYMRLDSLYQNGVDFDFDFYLVKDSMKKKLAYARAEFLWTVRTGSNVLAKKMPDKIFSYILSLGAE